MAKEKKSLFERAIDALTNREEKESADSEAKAGSEARANLAVDRGASQKTASETLAAQQAATEKPDVEVGPKTAVNPAARRSTVEKTTSEVDSDVPRKGVVRVRSLRIRADHNTASEVVGGLVNGNEVMVLDTWSDGKNTWARLDKGWAAMLYDGETYIELS